MAVAEDSHIRGNPLGHAKVEITVKFAGLVCSNHRKTIKSRSKNTHSMLCGHTCGRLSHCLDTRVVGSDITHIHTYAHTHTRAGTRKESSSFAAYMQCAELRRAPGQKVCGQVRQVVAKERECLQGGLSIEHALIDVIEACLQHDTPVQRAKSKGKVTRQRPTCSFRNLPTDPCFARKNAETLQKRV